LGAHQSRRKTYLMTLHDNHHQFVARLRLRTLRSETSYRAVFQTAAWLAQPR
jgi:hypothetical protein